jgi:simple sugar transport system permease protein
MVALLALSLALVFLLAGFPLGRAFASLWSGSFGSMYALGSATLVRATPLILTGLAVTLAFRAGIWNIGAEGQLLAGAACVTALALAAPNAPAVLMIPLLLIVGAGAGALWASIAAALRRHFGVLEVISTIMLNFIAIHAVGYLVRGPLQEPLRIYPQSSEIRASWRIDPIWASSRLGWGFVVAIGCALALWWVLTRTAEGFRIRLIGANAEAARSAGQIDVPSLAFRVFLLSGAFAGLAGAIEILAVTGALYENLSPGYGYTAIAVALLARLNPLAVIPSAIVFGALEAGAAAMQRDAGIPSVVVWIVEAVLLFGILLIEWLRGRTSLVAPRSGAVVTAP